MTKPTLGTISSDLLNKHKDKIDPQEIQRAQEKEYLDNLIWAVKHAQKTVPCDILEGHLECSKRDALIGDFFVVVLLKKEKLLENVLRNYFLTTSACPTPSYDQTVYRYDSKKEDVEFLWVVPDKETCEIFKENITKRVPEEQGLLSQILRFYDGTLFRMCKQFNGEIMARGGALEGV